MAKVMGMMEKESIDVALMVEVAGDILVEVILLGSGQQLGRTE